ncbi:MAG: thermonuclease family protein [Candidatus Pacebacteria bacterium]|nr:thermonuclease family protein [Candidatus Paceibacterota bacterium]
MSKKKKAILSAITTLLAASGLTGYTIVKTTDIQQPNFETQEHKITKIIDGDTLKIKTGILKTRKIRLIGINAPEKGACYYEESKEALTEITKDKNINIEKDISGLDKYKRLLRYVIVIYEDPEQDNIPVNYYMIRNGFAFYQSSPPDNRYRDLFITAQRQAQEDNLGLWKDCDYQEQVSEGAAALREQSTEPIDPECIIKGNISDAGYGKIYLLPGCDNYKRTIIDTRKGESYFCTEQEAQSAGFRKATNCP